MAYRRQDGRFNLHYSHGGAQAETAGEITPDTPFGGPNDGAFAAASMAFAAMLADSVDGDLEVNENIADPDDTTIKPDPMEIGVGVDGIVEELPECPYEMVFIVEPVVDDGETVDMHVRAYRVLYDLNHDEILLELPTRIDGGYREDSYTRGWFAGVTEQCEDLVENDVIDESVANERLLNAVLGRFEERLDRSIWALSPAVTEAHHEQYPEAFIRFSGRSRVLGQMYPTRIEPPDDWELPEGFPSVKTADGERVELV